MSIKADSFAAEINKILGEYGNSVNDRIKANVEEVAQECANQLKDISPKRTKNYAKNWAVVKDSKTYKTVATVYNKKFYRLTHLLENGHARRDGGRVDGIPHISIAEEKAVAELEKRIREDLK